MDVRFKAMGQLDSRVDDVWRSYADENPVFKKWMEANLRERSIVWEIWNILDDLFVKVKLHSIK